MPDFSLIIVFLLTYFLTKVAFAYVVKRGLLDYPGVRTSHEKATPRGGGISIVVTFLVFLIWFFVSGYDQINKTQFMSIVLGSGIVALIGFWDDHRHIPARWRFIVQVIAAVLSLFLLDVLPTIPFFFTELSFPLLVFPFYILTLVWFLNLYNFMDGIDGIACIEAITVAIAAGLIVLFHGDNTYSQILFTLAACVSGFLVWNWPPAKIFMGDASSGFLGFTLGLIAIITSQENSINLWSWFILLSVFIVDATYTLVRRIVNGDKWYEAHRSHAYQILARKFSSHKKVSVGVFFINLIWLFPLAFLASVFHYWAPVISLVAIFPLVYIAYKVNAGFRNN